MSFENQEPKNEPGAEAQEQGAEQRLRGVKLKGAVALLNGFLSARKQGATPKEFFLEGIRGAQDTYKALHNFEKEIDPTGNLSGDIEDRIRAGANKVGEWLGKSGGNGEDFNK